MGCWPPAGSRACHALGGPARAAGPTAGVALAHFPGETTKVLLFVPFFFFSVPKSHPGFVCEQEKEDTTRQEITALHLSKFQKYTACYFSPVTYVLWEM